MHHLLSLACICRIHQRCLITSLNQNWKPIKRYKKLTSVHLSFHITLEKPKQLHTLYLLFYAVAKSSENTAQGATGSICSWPPICPWRYFRLHNPPAAYITQPEASLTYCMEEIPNNHPGMYKDLLSFKDKLPTSTG